MRDSLAVGLIQRAGNLNRITQCLIQRYRPAFQTLGQRLAIDIAFMPGCIHPQCYSK